jgi:hypothetical protein
MWMQILIAAGFPHIGEAFPEPWGGKLHAANPQGFFESELVGGIYHATNPHPQTGTYLFPEQTRRHTTKVFIPGLIRTDLAFIDCVVATVRDWRAYAASMERMRSLLDEDREAELFDVPLSPALRWWMENFGLIRDIGTRRYAAHVTTYERLLADPEGEIGTVLTWLGEGDLEAACAAVEPAMRTQEGNTATPSDLDPRHAAVFDDLYDQLHEGRDLSASFVETLNRTDAELRPRIMRVHDAVRTQVASRLAAATLAEVTR